MARKSNGKAIVSNPVGAPLKLTRDKMETIVKALRLGNYMETAAAYVGVPKQTLFNWLRYGSSVRDEIELGRTSPLTDREALCLEFFDSVSVARAEGELRLVKRLDNVGKDDWRAIAWRLERLAPTRYGRMEFTVNETDDVKDEPVTDERKRLLVMRLLSMAQRVEDE